MVASDEDMMKALNLEYNKNVTKGLNEMKKITMNYQLDIGLKNIIKKYRSRLFNSDDADAVVLISSSIGRFLGKFRGKLNVLCVFINNQV